MSNQIPTDFGVPASPESPKSPATPASPKSGDVSGVNATAVNALADKVDARATALRGVAGECTDLATQAKTDITAAAQGYPIGEKIITALEGLGTKFNTKIGALATGMESDAKTLRGVVSGRKTIEKDTKKAMENAGEGLTYV